MKTLKLALVAAAAAVVMVPAQAQGLSYNVGVFTSNTDFEEAKDFKPSVSLGADYDFGNGFYAGAGYSTGKFKDQTKSRGELTLTAGYGNELANGISYDLSVSRYIYASNGASNGNDATLAVGYGPVTVAYTKAFTGSSFDSGYDLDVTYSLAINEKLGADFTVTKTSNTSSLDYELAFGYDLGNNLTATAAINKDKPKLVLGLSKSF
jgi:uncharacterized protein (TIGR02001 family)